MSDTSKKSNQHCDWCGKHPTKIHRRYKDEGYCINCYKTWFIKKPCVKCGEINRLHKKEENACCINCIRKQPCIRCGSKAYNNGANSLYGRVCASCYSYYFAKKKKCFECEELKHNVSRYSELHHNQPVCINCFQKHVHETCSSCRRYRRLLETPSGKICKTCNELGEIPCQVCKNPMPAGYGTQCWNCYWSQKLEHEVSLNTYLFTSKSIKHSYTEFVGWYEQKQSANIAVLKHNKFVDFFTTCDQTWGLIPNYETLIHEFKPSGLWHYLTVLRWLIATNRVVVNEAIKLQIAEQSYIEKALLVFEVTPDSIQAYHEFLNQKLAADKTTIKSVRLALRPAIDIYNKYSLRSSETPSQEQIDIYLLEKKGQFNALYGFITFLNRAYSLNLRYERPSEQDIACATRKQLEKQIMKLANKANLSKNDELLWYQLGLAYFHNLKVHLKDLKTISIEKNDNRMIMITIKDKEYWLPFEHDHQDFFSH